MTVPGDTLSDHAQSGEAPLEHHDPSDLIATWSASGVTVTDIAVERRWTTKKRLGWYALAVIAAIALTVGILISSGTNPSLFCCLLAVLGAGVAVGLPLWAVARGSAGREARRAIREAPGDRIQAALAEHLPKLPAEYLHGVLKHVAQRFVDSGRLGCVLRIGPAESFGRVEPLAVPFEPHMLDAIDEESQSESGEPGTDAEPSHEHSYASVLRDSFRPLRKWLDRYGQWINLLVWATLGIGNSLLSGRIHFLVYGLAAGLLVSLVLRLRQSGLRERQAFVVPGALIVRESGWRSRHWTMTVFEPRETAFLTCRFPDGRWELLLSSQTQMYYFRVTPAQAEAALRAWLSPLAPPTLEQLSDLR